MQTVSAALALVMGLTALPALADISVRFIEGAPKDRFEITNLATCAVVRTDLVIDLSTSAAGLIFDTTSTGAGVDVFQPFELVAGADALASQPKVIDGDKQVKLPISRLAPKAVLAFTIDVDNTMTSRGIMVSGSQIEGVSVRVSAAGTTTTGRFSQQGNALIQTPPCI